MDPDTIPNLRSRIRMDLLPYCEDGSMIPVDLSANCEGGSVIGTDPGSRSLGSDPGIRFRDPWAYLLYTYLNIYCDSAIIHAVNMCVIVDGDLIAGDPGGTCRQC